MGKSLELTRSVEGRAIRVVELGRGPRWVAVIGGIHQGNEANTTDLVKLLLDHFRANLDLIPDGVGVALIPDLNPDGAVAGTRENANGVDLNRNWDAELAARQLRPLRAGGRRRRHGAVLGAGDPRPRPLSGRPAVRRGDLLPQSGRPGRGGPRRRRRLG